MEITFRIFNRAFLNNVHECLRPYILPVINVPIQDDDIVKTITCLPRTSANDGFITVNLKRMKSLRKNEMQEDVKPDQLFEALEYLRLNKTKPKPYL